MRENQVVDIDLIVGRFEIIENALNALRDLRELEYPEFAEAYFLRSAAERELQVAIQAALDIGDVIIAEEAGAETDDYLDIFTTLAELGVLPASFAEHFNRMAEFRNVLVYLYEDIDPAQMYELMHEDLVDFDLFMQYVGTYITEHYGDIE